MELSERKREILRLVVEEYVSTGQPVGSKGLVREGRLHVSSSTVRSSSWSPGPPASRSI
jgi:heat-inducible transcriptional repressor